MVRPGTAGRWAALNVAGDGVVDALAANAARRRRPSALYRRALTGAAGVRSGSAIPALQQVLKDENRYVLSNAVDALQPHRHARGAARR
ncbi:MAG: hypothetical protein R2911_29810 [Caldilineaceae bacterium]